MLFLLWNISILPQGSMKPVHEVAEVLQMNADVLPSLVANSWQLRTLHALRKCRTAELGGHIDRCDQTDCGHLHLSYNSCRNRHCPKCQGHKREEWMQARQQELLPVPYYHVVFTIPSELNRLCLHQPKKMYNLLFASAWKTIQGFAANEKFLAAKTGMIAVLHTWGQNLSLHPHLHCIVLGGGIDKQNCWKAAKGKGKYLFPVKAMSRVFRSKFMHGLRKEDSLKREMTQQISHTLFAKDWVVYCKRPFAHTASVVEYLGRYTHKIAISNHRITKLIEGTISFTVKNYRKQGKKEVITLSQHEFIRRFAQHILPKGFVRIRHYGILSSSYKKTLLPKLRKQLYAQKRLRLPKEKPIVTQLHRCPKCKKGQMKTLLTFDRRGPPSNWKTRLKNLMANPISKS